MVLFVSPSLPRLPNEARKALASMFSILDNVDLRVEFGQSVEATTLFSFENVNDDNANLIMTPGAFFPQDFSLELLHVAHRGGGSM